MRSEPDRVPDGTVRAALGTLLTTGLVCAIGAVLAQRATIAEGAQALVANAGASFLGADGSTKQGAEGTARALAGWAARGAALAVGFTLVTIGLARATNAVAPVTVSTFAPGILFGLLDATLVAMRDEFLLHGLVLRVARNPPRARALGLAACALASAAWSIGTAGASGVPVTRVLVEALLGVSFGAMWQRERGASMAVTAHALWLFATTGGLASLRPRAGFWGGGDAGFLAAGSALAAATLAAAAAVAWTLRTSRASRGETSTSRAAVG